MDQLTRERYPHLNRGRTCPVHHRWTYESAGFAHAALAALDAHHLRAGTVEPCTETGGWHIRTTPTTRRPSTQDIRKEAR